MIVNQLDNHNRDTIFVLFSPLFIKLPEYHHVT